MWDSSAYGDIPEGLAEPDDDECWGTSSFSSAQGLCDRAVLVLLVCALIIHPCTYVCTYMYENAYIYAYMNKHLKFICGFLTLLSSNALQGMMFIK